MLLFARSFLFLFTAIATTSFSDNDPSLEARLKEAIGKATEGPKAVDRQPNQTKVIKQEMLHFDTTHELGPLLSKLLGALKTIQPSSTESERTFSSSANFCTKRRTRLNDESLNALCFLKCYFLAKKNY